MSLQITEKKNDKLSLHNSKNNLDGKLGDDIPSPLPNYSGFSMLICGSAGSGKTTMLYSMMSAKKKERSQTIVSQSVSSHIYCITYNGE